MQTIHQRLVEARRNAGYVTASEAADAHGWAKPTYLGHENGSRGLRIDSAKKYAAAFRVGLSWLLNGTGDAPGSDGSEAERLLVIKGIKLGLQQAGIAPETRDWYEAITSALREYDALFPGNNPSAPVRKPDHVAGRARR